MDKRLELFLEMMRHNPGLSASRIMLDVDQVLQWSSDISDIMPPDVEDKVLLAAKEKMARSLDMVGGGNWPSGNEAKEIDEWVNFIYGVLDDFKHSVSNGAIHTNLPFRGAFYTVDITRNL